MADRNIVIDDSKMASLPSLRMQRASLPHTGDLTWHDNVLVMAAVPHQLRSSQPSAGANHDLGCLPGVQGAWFRTPARSLFGITARELWEQEACTEFLTQRLQKVQLRPPLPMRDRQTDRRAHA